MVQMIGYLIAENEVIETPIQMDTNIPLTFGEEHSDRIFNMSSKRVYPIALE
jgi:hypothetical protein